MDMFRQEQRLVPAGRMKPAVPLKTLVAQLKHPDVEVRREAISELGEASSAAIPHLVGALLDDDICSAAVIALREHGSDVERPLLCAMGHPDPRVREKAILALEQLRWNRKRVTRPIVHATRDPVREVRLAALGALAACDPEDEEVAHALAEALETNEMRARWMAAWTVAYTTIDGPTLFAATRRAMKDPDTFLRCLAVMAFTNRFHWTSAAVADLEEAARDRDCEVRLAAVTAMSRGGQRPECVPALTEALKDPLWLVRETALCALGGYREKAIPAIPMLVRILKDPVPDIADRAAHVLGWLGPVASAAVPSLLRMARKKGPYLQADWALARIGTGAVPYLLKSWRGANRKYRDLPGSRFRIFIEQCPVAVSALVEAMDHRDAFVRRESAAVLPQIKGAEKGVPKLVSLLGDPEASVRKMAAWALGEIGPKAAEALPALSGLATDPDSRVREIALLAAKKVKP